MITQSCNLKCTYCYGGESGTYQTKGLKMDLNVAKAAIDFLVNSRPKTKQFQITFFGGEPLLNFDLMRYIFDYCEELEVSKQIEFSYTMTTNATLITDEKAEYLASKKISIMVSLDGPKEINDKNRVQVNGIGSFDKVIAGIEKLKSNNIPFSVRSTQTSLEFSEFEQTLDFFRSLGATQMHVANVSNYEENLIQFDQSPEKIIAFSESMRNYMRQIEQKILNGERVDYIPFLTALQKIHTGGKSMISCGVMKGTTAVGVNGDFYPCHRFVGMPGYEYGNVFDGINQIKQKTICDNLDNANTNCNRCFARYICSRGCIRDVATSDTGFKEYDEATFCTTMRELVVEYLAIYANLKLAKPEVFAQIDKKLQEVNIIEQDV